MNTTSHLCACLAGAFAIALLPAVAVAAPVPAAKSISNTGSLAFGRFVAGSGGTVNVAVSGARSRTGGVVLLSSSAAAASFTVGDNNNGNDNKVYVLTLPANGTVTLASGANRMAVNGFASSFTAGSPLPSGAQTVTVGAVLQVSPNQAPGAYSGSFNVTLEYQ